MIAKIIGSALVSLVSVSGMVLITLRDGPMLVNLMLTIATLVALAVMGSADDCRHARHVGGAEDEADDRDMYGTRDGDGR